MGVVKARWLGGKIQDSRLRTLKLERSGQIYRLWESELGFEQVVPEPDQCSARYFGTSSQSHQEKVSPDQVSGLDRAGIY